MPIQSGARRSSLRDPYRRWAEAQEQHRKLEEQIASLFSNYLLLVEDALEKVPHILPGDAKSARELAVHVAAQGLARRGSFLPGTILRRKDAPYDIAIVIGTKPIGFKEKDRWNYVHNKPSPAIASSHDLVWTAPLEANHGHGYGQSLASSWECAPRQDIPAARVLQSVAAVQRVAR
jgi:hypothetical protein